MKVMHLESMTKGWFVGHFKPTLLDTQAAEVSVKHYKAGDHEAEHFHKVATEITAVIQGRVRMMNQEFGPGDLVLLEPGEATDFHVLEPSVTVVVKVPGASNDKYLTGK